MGILSQVEQLAHLFTEIAAERSVIPNVLLTDPPLELSVPQIRVDSSAHDRQPQAKGRHDDGNTNPNPPE